jgi:hypothetical protein
LDQGWFDTLTYCDRWPAFNGPKPIVNGICWAAKKDPGWYAQVKSAPLCPGTKIKLNVGRGTVADLDEPPPDMADIVEPASGASKYLMYAGIGLLGLVVVGAAVTMGKKK